MTNYFNLMSHDHFRSHAALTAFTGCELLACRTVTGAVLPVVTRCRARCHSHVSVPRPGGLPAGHNPTARTGSLSPHQPACHFPCRCDDVSKSDTRRRHCLARGLAFRRVGAQALGYGALCRTRRSVPRVGYHLTISTAPDTLAKSMRTHGGCLSFATRFAVDHGAA